MTRWSQCLYLYREDQESRTSLNQGLGSLDLKCSVHIYKFEGYSDTQLEHKSEGQE